MFIDKNSVVINSVNMGQYLVSVEYGYYKLWGKDAGRNLKGSWTGSFVGVYPKLTLQFRKLTRTEVEYLAPVLDSAYQSTTYYDPNKKASYTMATYSNDWVVKDKSIIDANHKNDGFTWSVIAKERRQ